MSALLGTLFGRYRLEQSLGRGGMAEVFRATDERLGRAVAVKVILPSFAEQPQFVDRFLREARLVAALEHPNIVPVYDFGDQAGVPYLVMPYLAGGTLSGRLTGSPLPLATVASWVRQLAEALDAAHEQRVLHRDVKPGNVLIGKGDRVLLADFGIAKMAESATRLTATGVVVGTPMYMAPEIAQGTPASPASDLYALAVMAYEMLTGKPPFEGQSALAVLHQHVTTPAPRPSVRCPELTTALDPVFAAALAKDPQQRPRPCRAFAEELESIVATGERPAVTLALPTEVGLLPTRAMPAFEPGAVVPSPPRVAGRLAVVAGLLALSIVGWMMFARMRSTPPVPPPTVALSAPISAPVAAVAGPPVSATQVRQADRVPPASPTSAPEPERAAEVRAEPAAPEPAAPEPARDQVSLPDARLPEASEGTSPPTAAPGRGLLAERLRRRAGGGRAGGGGAGGGRQPGLAGGAAAAQPEATRPTATRLDAAGFERMREGASRTERAGNPRATSLRTYAEGGLLYLRREDAKAARKLQELASLEASSGTDLGPLSLLRKLAGGGAIQPWLVAVAYTDARHEAAALVASELAVHPDSLAARLGKAMVEHLDGQHRQAAETAEALHATAPSALAPRLAFYAGEEREHAGDLEAALAWLRSASASPVAAEAGVAALQAARLALKLERTDEARRILETACRNQARLACDRLRELGAAE